jgi:Na+/proline symporter
MSRELVLVVAIGYLLALFAIAFLVERRSSSRLGKLTGSSLVYTLSLAVYCSSWTFNGGVGRASQNGFDFLPIYLGPTLAFILGPIVIRRMLQISKANNITSIADLIGARFGRSAGVAGLVTVIAVVGLIPYIALQLKSIAQGFAVLTLTSPDPAHQPVIFDGALWAAAILTVFAMLFGSRSIHPGEHHPGMVVAIAAESILKLLSLTIIGLFVVYGLFHGFGDLFGKAADNPEVAQVFAYAPDRYGFSWIAMTFLAMVASFCLPRQFQVIVVENVDERHLDRAIWQFPLYLLLINLFVLPIAVAGRLLLPGNANPDNLVLALPLLGNQQALALIAFLGGVSAAASMVVVETTALSTMVCNDVVMPALLRVKSLGLAQRSDPPAALGPPRRDGRRDGARLPLHAPRQCAGRAGLDRSHVVCGRCAVRAGAGGRPVLARRHQGRRRRRHLRRLPGVGLYPAAAELHPAAADRQPRCRRPVRHRRAATQCAIRSHRPRSRDPRHLLVAPGQYRCAARRLDARSPATDRARPGCAVRRRRQFRRCGADLAPHRTHP